MLEIGFLMNVLKIIKLLFSKDLQYPCQWEQTKFNIFIRHHQQQQHLFTKDGEKTMMEGQRGYEKHLWPPATKREKNMNNLNNQNLALSK